MKFPSVETLKDRGTRKWTVYGEDVLPLWIAESDFPTAPPVLEAIRRHVETEGLGYTPSPKVSGLSPALSEFYAEHFGWRPDPTRVMWIGDVVRGLLLGAQYFTREDSALIVPVPSYPPLLELAKTAGREMIQVDVSAGFTDSVLDEIERAFAAGAGALVLANPYNPLGLVLEEDTLRRLVEIAARHDGRILSDEIHAPLVFDGRHTPVASLGEDGAKVAYTVTSTSKAWNVAGLKCAQVILSNPEDVQTWNNLTGVAKDGTGTLGVFAAEACWSQGADFLAEEVEYLRANRDWLCEVLPQKIPGIKTTCPQATYLMWLDFRETAIPEQAKEHPAKWLTEHAKVALNEGVSFGPGGAGHARLNFATSREILEEAVDRLAQAIG